MGGGRGDDDEVGAAGQGDVFVGKFGGGVVGVGYDRAVGDAAESEGRYKVGGAVGQDGVDLGAGLGQPAGEVEGFVAGDAAGNAEDDVFID